MAYQSRLELVVDSRKGEQNLRRMDSALERTERQGMQTFGNLKTVAAGFAGVLATIGVGAGFASTFNTLAQFDKELATLGSVAQASKEELEAFAEQARVLGSTTVYGANQAAQAQKFLAQGGLEVNEVLGATPQVLKLAQAGMLDLGQAADLATDVMDQMGLAVADITRVSDVLVATGQSATTDVNQLGQALSYAGGQASGFGLTLEETVGALGRISSAGIKATRAGTGLVGVLAQLSNVSGPAEEILKAQGIALSDLDVEARGVIPVLETLAEANLDMGEQVKIFGREAAGAANALLSNLPAYREQVTALQDVTGRANEAANQMSDNLASSAVGLGSAFEGLILKTGDDGLTGALQSVIDTAAGVVRVWGGLGDTLDESFSDDQVSTIHAWANGIELLAVAAGARLTTALANATAAKVKDTAASVQAAKAESVAAQAAARRTAAELQAAKTVQARAIADAKATAGTNAHAFAMQNLTAATARTTAAQAAHTSATNAASAAMGRASIAARGLSGAMALAGGPIGLMVGAGGLLYAFRDELGLVSDQAEITTQRIDDLTDSINTNSKSALEAGIIQLTAEYVKLGNEAQNAQARIDELTAAQQDDRRGAHQNLMNQMKLEDAENSLKRINAEQEAAGESADELREILGGLGDQSVETTNSLGGLEDSAKGTSEAAKEAARQAEQFASSLQSLEDRLFPVEAAQRQFRQEQIMLQTALMQGRISIERYFEALERLDTLRSRDITGGFMESVDTGGLAKEIDKTSGAARDLGMTFQSAFEDAIIEGENFRGVLQGVFEDIQRILIRRTITEPAETAISGALDGFSWGGLFNGLLGGGGGGGTYTGGTVGSLYPGMSEGGYTGDGGKYEPKGIVHGGEFVVKKSVVDNPGVRPMLERLNKGYANGGYVGPSSGATANPGVVVNVHTDGDAQVSQQESRRSDGTRQLDLYIERKVRGTVRGMFGSGEMDRTMRQFGARRQST